MAPAHQAFAKQPDRLGIRNLVGKAEPEKSHERQAVLDDELGLVVGEIGAVCPGAQFDALLHASGPPAVEGADITMHLVGFVERPLTGVGGYHSGRRRLLRV
jgi:hypothetical protein